MIEIICRLCQRTIGRSEFPGKPRASLGGPCARCREELSGELAPNGIGFMKRGKPMPWRIPDRFRQGKVA